MGRRILLGSIAILAALIVGFLQQVNAADDHQFWALKFHDHSIMEEMENYGNSYINKGRVQIYRLQPGVTYADLPDHIRQAIEPIDPKVMSLTPMSRVGFEVRRALGLIRPNQKVKNIISGITEESMRAQTEVLVSIGRRTNQTTFDVIMDTFRSYGYQPTHDYNIEAFIEGTTKPDELVIIEGHMDTVSGTVGADDNASGASAVLEAARILSGLKFERSVLFLITEDEERGLLGAKRKVKQLKDEGRIDQVKFVVNMDMIGVNENGIVDLETKPQFEYVVDWMADQVRLYTNLEPNKVLQAWGSDHVPFIDAGVPCLLTIEHWNTHTPCCHKSCDTIDTINFAYATQIAQLNAAAITLQAGLIP
jgi:hypothetical protein